MEWSRKDSGRCLAFVGDAGGGLEAEHSEMEERSEDISLYVSLVGGMALDDVGINIYKRCPSSGFQ